MRCRTVGAFLLWLLMSGTGRDRVGLTGRGVFVTQKNYVSVVVVLLSAIVQNVDSETLSGLGALLPSFITQNFDDLVNAAAATCEALPLNVLFSREYTYELPYLDIVEFRRDSRRTYRVARVRHLLRDIRPSPDLVFYIPGWWNTPTDESSISLVEALLHKHPVVLVLDTRLSFCRGYISSASRVKPVAHLLFKMIKNLNREGVSLDSIHLIGFSLGAHVAGITGKLIQREMGKKLGRITALDPAKPCFSRLSEFRLDKNDAMFVQVIHTSAGVLGLEQAVGHTDVYVNGVSVRQPECRDSRISLECDHAQAWKLYSASVMGEQYMMAKKCHSWQELKRGKCSGNETVVGYECSAATRGMFLYKSKESARKIERELKVFNPLDLFTWWLERQS